MKENSLFQLVKSLSPAEKRYFRLFAARQERAGKKNYMKLFDVLDEMEAYDQELLYNKAKLGKFYSQLHITGNYLGELLLKCLRIYYDEVSVESQVMNLLRETELVYIRGLYKMAYRLVKRAEDLVWKYEKFNLAAEVYRWHDKLILVDREDHFSESLGELLEKQQRASMLYLNTIGYNELNHRLRILLKLLNTGARDEQEMARFDELMSDPLLKEEGAALTLESKHRYLHFHILNSAIRGNNSKAFELSKRQVKLYEEQPHHIEARLELYLQALCNLADRQIERDDVSGLEQQINEIEKVLDHYRLRLTDNVSAKIFSKLCVYKLEIYFRRGSCKEAMALLRYIEDGLTMYENTLGKEQHIILWSNLAILHFAAGDHPGSLRWVNRVLNDTDPEIRKDVHAWAKIFSLVVHVELKNFDVLPYMARSTYRFFLGRNKLRPFEALVLKALRKLPSVAGQDALDAFYRSMHVEMTTLLQDKMERKVFEYFDFIAWLESKIGSVSFEEAVQRKIARSNAMKDTEAV